MSKSRKTIEQIHALLREFGVKNIVFGAGGRHLPLIHSIEQDEFFTTYRMVDERSAAFFALGIIQQTGEPAAVCCTSGTACINLASAVVEAYYQHLPLLVISGDRMREYLNQNEDQLYDQIESFKGFIKYAVQLPRIDSDTDLWFTNRVINEALIELTHRGCGPVHIDFPIENPFADVFELESMPEARKISLVTAECRKAEWDEIVEMLQGKKVAVVWGQSVPYSDSLAKSVEHIGKVLNAVVLTDYMSNCRIPSVITNAPRLLHTIFSSKEREDLLPDIVITVGGNTIFNSEMKAFVNNANIEHWHVSPEGSIRDEYKRQTMLFDMSEEFFFSHIIAHAKVVSHNTYLETWQSLEMDVPIPHSDNFDELHVIESLVNHLPDNSNLQVGNSWSVRMSQLFKIPNSCGVFCNRGVNGIDGSMSTAVGFAASGRSLTFLVIGDLSFFYDMNALWSQHLSSNMRILLINNQGGSMLYKPFMRELMEKCPMANLGLGKQITAEGWCKTVGMNYHSACSNDELEKEICWLTQDKHDKPAILEVFTDFFNDANSYFQNCSYDRRNVAGKIKSKAANVLKKLV